MRICPECGHENADTDRYCSNCGASLSNVDVTPPPPPTSPPEVSGDIGETPAVQADETGRAADRGAVPSAIPPPVDFRPPPGASVEEEWRMTSLGPPPKQRRTWLWVVVGIIGVCLLACVAFLIFISTDTGQDWYNDLQTEVSERATEQAD